MEITTRTKTVVEVSNTISGDAFRVANMHGKCYYIPYGDVGDAPHLLYVSSGIIIPNSLGPSDDDELEPCPLSEALECVEGTYSRISRAVHAVLDERGDG